MSSEESTARAPARQAGAPAPAKTPPEIQVKVSWCKGCGLCVEYCNREVLVMEGPLPKVVQAERCTRCLQCEAICPDFAIRIEDGEDGGGPDRAEEAAP